jgi:hypothetical protein
VATRRLRQFLSAAATFDCDPSEAEFQKLFSTIVHIESAPLAPDQGGMRDSQPPAEGPSAASAEPRRVRSQPFGVPGAAEVPP